MFNFFDRIQRLNPDRKKFSDPRLSKASQSLREQLKQVFLNQNEHNWMNTQEKVRANFEKLFQFLPITALETLIQQHICFVCAEDLQSKNILNFPTLNLVVLKPAYLKLIQKVNDCALAYLAHEIGMMIYELSAGHKLTPDEQMLAEVETDKWLCDLGLAEGLEQCLLAFDESHEKRLRLTYLTVRTFTGQ
jgi:hypothetical protein